MKARDGSRWTSKLRIGLLLVGVVWLTAGPLTSCRGSIQMSADESSAFAGADGPDRDGGYHVTIQLPGEPVTGFLVAINHEGGLVEVGPRFDVGKSGETIVYYNPSASRPNLADSVEMIAVYADEHRMYIRLR